MPRFKPPSRPTGGPISGLRSASRDRRWFRLLPRSPRVGQGIPANGSRFVLAVANHGRREIRTARVGHAMAWPPCQRKNGIHIENFFSFLGPGSVWSSFGPSVSCVRFFCKPRTWQPVLKMRAWPSGYDARDGDDQRRLRFDLGGMCVCLILLFDKQKAVL